MPLAIVYNHDMGCLVGPLEVAGLVGETLIYEGPNTGTVFDPGVVNIEMTRIAVGTRLDAAQVQRMVDNYPIHINGIEYNLPILTLKGFGLGGQSYDCPTIAERASGVFGRFTNRAEQVINDIDLKKIFESVGEALGAAFGNLAQGAQKGFHGALND